MIENIVRFRECVYKCVCVYITDYEASSLHNPSEVLSYNHTTCYINHIYI